MAGVAATASPEALPVIRSTSFPIFNCNPHSAESNAAPCSRASHRSRSRRRLQYDPAQGAAARCAAMHAWGRPRSTLHGRAAAVWPEPCAPAHLGGWRHAPRQPSLRPATAGAACTGPTAAPQSVRCAPAACMLPRQPHGPGETCRMVSGRWEAPVQDTAAPPSPPASAAAAPSSPCRPRPASPCTAHVHAFDATHSANSPGSGDGE